jgi:hypothetical protein
METRRFIYAELTNADIGPVTSCPRYAGYLHFTDRRTGSSFGFDGISETKGALLRFVKDASERAQTG